MTAARLAARDLVLLAARLLLAVVLLAHGLPKLRDGVGATADGFAQMGVPYSEAAAVFAIIVEVGLPALLALGFLTPLVGLVVAGHMGGAFWYAHRGTEPLVTEGGWELVALIGGLALLVAVVGAGRLSVDAALFGRRGRRAAHADRGDDSTDRAADDRMIDHDGVDGTPPDQPAEYPPPVSDPPARP